MIKLNIEYELGDLKFEWDSVEEVDENHSDFEDRYKIIGRVEKILVVIYTERGDKNRIISARTANKKETEDYYEQFYD